MHFLYRPLCHSSVVLVRCPKVIYFELFGFFSFFKMKTAQSFLKHSVKKPAAHSMLLCNAVIYNGM